MPEENPGERPALQGEWFGGALVVDVPPRTGPEQLNNAIAQLAADRQAHPGAYPPPALLEWHYDEERQCWWAQSVLGKDRKYTIYGPNSRACDDNKATCQGYEDERAAKS